MKRLTLLVIAFLLLINLISCQSGQVSFPHSSGTNVNLSGTNYKIAETNVIGSDRGFYFLWFIPLVPPYVDKAMIRLYDQAGMKPGKSMALVNVVQGESLNCFILFSLPRVTIMADVIEFVEPVQTNNVEKPTTEEDGAP